MADNHVPRVELKAFLDGIADGVCLSDDSGKVVYANRAARALLQITEPLKGPKRICDLFCKRMRVHGELSPANCPLRVPGRAEDVATFRGHLPTRPEAGNSAPDGGLELRVRGLRMHGRRLEHCHMTIIEDVAAEAEFEKRREDWRGMVAHDLRSPLTNVLGALRMLEELPPDQPLGAHDRELVSFGVRSALKMRTLLDEYLEVARAEAGALHVSHACIDLARLARETAAEIREQARAAGIEVRLHIPDSLYCDGDLTMLTRVLQNLLDNALKFTPYGGRVTLTIDSRGKKAVLSVSDTGQGIDAADLPHIFDRFYQGEGAGRRKGLGLGLTFCREALRVMSGEISVDSTLGKGSVFTCSLPLAGAGAAAAVETATAECAPAVSESRASRSASRCPSRRKARRRCRSGPGRAARPP